jgi:hypothetical protein
MKTRRDSFKVNRRAEWMAAFEAAAVRLNPSLSGKIDWNTATFFYNEGRTPDLAAKSMAGVKAS